MLTHFEIACNGFVVLPPSPPPQAQKGKLLTPQGKASRREEKGRTPGSTQQQKTRQPTQPPECPPRNARGSQSQECLHFSQLCSKYPPSFPLAEHPLPFRIGGWVGSAAELLSLCSGCSCRTQRRWWRRCRDWGA